MNKRLIFLDSFVTLFIIYGIYLEMSISFLEPGGDLILFASVGFIILFIPFVYILEHPKVLGLNLPIKKNAIWKYPHKFTLRVVIIFFALVTFSNAYLVKFPNSKFGEQEESNIALILLQKNKAATRHNSDTFVANDRYKNIYYLGIHSNKLFKKYNIGDSFNIKVYTGSLGKTYYINTLLGGGINLNRFERATKNYDNLKEYTDPEKIKKKETNENRSHYIVGILVGVFMLVLKILKKI